MRIKLHKLYKGLSSRCLSIPLTLLIVSTITSCANGKVEVTPLKPLVDGFEATEIADFEPLDEVKKNLFQAGNMQRMTLSFVATKILSTNPDIEIFSAREAQARFSVEMSRSKYWPTIDAKVSGGPENIYKPTGNTLGSQRNEASLALKTTLFDFGKRDKDVAQSEAAYEAAQLRSKDKIDAILLTLANAYLDVLQSRDLARVTSKNIVQIHKFRNLVQSNLDEGNASVADLKKVEARLENARASYVDLKADYETSRENFKKITDFYPVNLQAPPQLSVYEKANFASDEFDLTENKNLLNAVRKDIESLKQKLEALEASDKPVLKFGALADYKKNVGGLNDPVIDLRLDLSIKYRLFDGGFKQAEQKKIEAEIREGRALLRKKTKVFEQDVRNADNDQKASSKKNALLATRFKAAATVVELNIEQFKEGVLTVFELLDAQAQLLSAKHDLIGNQYQKYRLRYKKLQLADRLVSALVVAS